VGVRPGDPVNSQFVPKWTDEDSRGPVDRFSAFKPLSSGLTETQVDQKFSKQYQIAVSDFSNRTWLRPWFDPRLQLQAAQKQVL
jgi:hypothetical protein